jgi:tRNA (guanine-N(7)-)-methyltransferase subunit TRM82
LIITYLYSVSVVLKKVTAILVTSDDYVVYADKFGHVHKFELAPFLTGNSTLKAEEHTLVLGHCSTLTDMKLSKDERYIITVDRDEKVRVSHWPNAYNIHTFCLGHTAYFLHFFSPSFCNNTICAFIYI